jgi:hypothetical protein
VNYKITAGSASLGASVAHPDSNGFSSVNLNDFASGRSSEHLRGAEQCLPDFQRDYGSYGVAPGPGSAANPADSAIRSGISTGDCSRERFEQPSACGAGRERDISDLRWAAATESADHLIGEAGISQPGMPVILAKSQATVQSDINNGLASFQLSTGGLSGNIAIIGSATAGNSSLPFVARQLEP